MGLQAACKRLRQRVKAEFSSVLFCSLVVISLEQSRLSVLVVWIAFLRGVSPRHKSRPSLGNWVPGNWLASNLARAQAATTCWLLAACLCNNLSCCIPAEASLALHCSFSVTTPHKHAPVTYLWSLCARIEIRRCYHVSNSTN